MIIFASFPRSGHHFVINTLSRVYKNISYCEKYKCEDQLGNKIDCAGKDLHLSQRQICKAGKRIQKTHDFLLNEPIIKKEGVKYFSLIRHPVPAIISRWKLNEVSLIKRNPNIDKKIIWEEFFKKQIKYYDGFIKKYIIDASHILKKDNNILKFANYEDITSDHETLMATLNYFMDENSIDLIPEIKFKTFIKLNTNVRNFEFYNYDFFKKIIKMYDFSSLKKFDNSNLIKF
ncbi:hypothetical protein [Candidatus Pelagibacter sp. HIMB1493]|uniref:hypothetical protein n=1 Tax=Candidatus Pelagibacter sp. HIMB1493 TaxID=3413334 RepID=UPI003F85B995